MKLHKHNCPVSWYIGKFFNGKRRSLSISKMQVAKELKISAEHLKLFEAGKIIIDAHFLINLEKLYGVSYYDYKPPICYYGFLGISSNQIETLQLAKCIIKKIIPIFKKSKDTEIEDALLKLHYSPKRGRTED